MADIVNLRQARKRKARDAARREGDANAAKHGRRKDDRDRDAAVTALEARRLDGHRRDVQAREEPDEDGDGPDASGSAGPDERD
ncbi:MAG: DUF4169 family protein [Pseudomonadota bacterium]|nr:DUF4169 family protein [Pseudomonadota bacterium]MEE3099906.1 DUF4169 family protein [Pseudomonadota bacterium]